MRTQLNSASFFKIDYSILPRHRKTTDGYASLLNNGPKPKSCSQLISGVLFDRLFGQAKSSIANNRMQKHFFTLFFIGQSCPLKDILWKLTRWVAVCSRWAMHRCSIVNQNRKSCSRLISGFFLHYFYARWFLLLLMNVEVLE